MKRFVTKLLPLVLFGLVGCAVEPELSSAPVEDTSSAASLDVSAATSELSVDATTAAPAGCYDAWECQRCGGQTRNVLVRTCTGGGRTVIRTRPCGEECF